jgi:hypothetical protein
MVAISEFSSSSRLVGRHWIVVARLTSGRWFQHRRFFEDAVAASKLQARVDAAGQIDLAHWRAAVGQKLLEADFIETVEMAADCAYDPDADHERWLETRYDADYEGFRRWEEERGCF